MQPGVCPPTGCVESRGRRVHFQLALSLVVSSASGQTTTEDDTPRVRLAAAAVLLQVLNQATEIKYPCSAPGCCCCVREPRVLLRAAALRYATHETRCATACVLTVEGGGRCIVSRILRASDSSSCCCAGFFPRAPSMACPPLCFPSFVPAAPARRPLRRTAFAATRSKTSRPPRKLRRQKVAAAAGFRSATPETPKEPTPGAAATARRPAAARRWYVAVLAPLMRWRRCACVFLALAGF